MPFPYFAILRTAWELVLKHRWLWVFGLFVGGTTTFNWGLGSPRTVSWASLEEFDQAEAVSWLVKNQDAVLAGLSLLLLLALVLLILQGLAKGALIWSAHQLSSTSQNAPQVPVEFRSALRAGWPYVWRIVAVHLLVLGVMALLLAVFTLPTWYLFSQAATGRAIILLLLGLGIAIPAFIIFGFVHLFAPIIAVVYNQRVVPAIALAIRLVYKKWKESVVLAAVLVGLAILVSVIILFGLVLLGLLIALLAQLLPWLPLVLAASVIGGIYVIVLRATFATFHNIAWVLAVKEMIRPQQSAEEARVAPAFSAAADSAGRQLLERRRA